MIDGLSAAVSGLNAAAAQVNAAANNIVNAHAESRPPVQPAAAPVVTGNGPEGGVAAGDLVHAQEQAGGVNIAAEAVRLIQAEAAYKASAAVVSTIDETSQYLIDAVG